MVSTTEQVTAPAPAPSRRRQRAATALRKQIGPADVIQWTGSNLTDVRSFTWRLFRVPAEASEPAITGEIFDAYAETWQPVRTGQWIVYRGNARFKILDDADFRAAYEIVTAQTAQTGWSM